MVFGLIGVMVDAIPTIDLDFDVTVGAIEPITSAISVFLPVKTIATCLTIVFLLDNSKFIISIFNFIVRKIPGIN